MTNQILNQEDRVASDGVIYILTNPAMEGLVKIGKTTRDVSTRVGELFTTEVPLPFRCVRAVRVPDMNLAEKALHRAFDPNRVHPRREFFEIEPEQAIALLDLIKTEDVTPSQADIDIADIDTPDKNKRRPNIRFDDMGIPVGSVLKFANGEMEATVVDAGTRVAYKGEESNEAEEFSISRLTRELLGYAKSPALSWTYKGRLLREISDEVHGWEG